MRILISNDDGVYAPGIVALMQALMPLGDVFVVAPDSERSGSSSALSLDRPLRVTQIQPNMWTVNGTPADCVYLAMNGLFDFEFDWVISGINSGANLGDDVLYSGTVGAAIEGRKARLGSIAVSLVGSQVRQYESSKSYMQAAQWIAQLIQQGLPRIGPQHIYNINIPDVLKLKGRKITYLGKRTRAKPMTSYVDPRGCQVYWVGLAGEAIVEPAATDGDIPSDFYAIAHHYVSITPIQLDMTAHAVCQQLVNELK